MICQVYVVCLKCMIVYSHRIVTVLLFWVKVAIKTNIKVHMLLSILGYVN